MKRAMSSGGLERSAIVRKGLGDVQLKQTGD